LPGQEMEGGALSPLSFASGLGTVQDCTEPLSQGGAFRSRPPRRTGPTSPPRVGLWATVTCGQRDRQIMADDRSTDTWIPCRAPLRLPRPNTEYMAGLAVELASLKDPIVGLSDRFSVTVLRLLLDRSGQRRWDGTKRGHSTAAEAIPAGAGGEAADTKEQKQGREGAQRAQRQAQ
jgi:hypothetical protein